MVNPFGTDSESDFALKEKLKRAEYEKALLTQRVSELKTELDSLKVIYSDVLGTKEKLDEENTRVKQELRGVYNISKERENTINDLQKQMGAANVDRLKEERTELRDQLEKLQGEIARGSVTTESISSKLASTITPIMLKEFDPTNPRYEDAFVDLVEAIIDEGDTIEKIIGLLVKHGGRGPFDSLKEMINSPEFDVALEVLAEENVLKVIEDDIVLVNSEDMIEIKKSWADLELDDLFDQMERILKQETEKVVVASIEKFRDALQEKEVPLTTMLFQIRKMAEGITKQTMTREEANKQLGEWRTKILGSD